MAKILAIGEIGNGVLRKVTREITSVGKSLSGSVDTVLIGEGASNVVSEVAKYGADTVYVNDTPQYNAEAYSKAIANLVKSGGYTIVLLPHSWTGRDLSARIATLLNSAVISDAIEVKLDGEIVEINKPIISGKAFVKLRSKSTPAVVTIRSNSQPIQENAGNGAKADLDISFEGVKVKEISFNEQETDRVSLTEADIVVSGGRGIKEADNFKPYIEELADILKAGLGATRAIVDSGWVDHTLQIGQTGQTVSPNLYIAVGLSGAIQHMSGMGSSKYIVAINKDPDAPIFKVATFSVVDDLFKVVPPLKDELKSLLGS